jgi:hypothetical protein
MFAHSACSSCATAAAIRMGVQSICIKTRASCPTAAARCRHMQSPRHLQDLTAHVSSPSAILRFMHPPPPDPVRAPALSTHINTHAVYTHEHARSSPCFDMRASSMSLVRGPMPGARCGAALFTGACTCCCQFVTDWLEASSWLPGDFKANFMWMPWRRQCV